MLNNPVQAAKMSCDTAGFTVEGLNSQYPPGVPKLDANSCVNIHMQGEILDGDYQAFRSLLKKAEPHVRDLSIISPGGDVSEAIRIGELIRDRMLITQTASRGDNGIDKLDSVGAYGLVNKCQDDECICASACFFIWAAGVNAVAMRSSCIGREIAQVISVQKLQRGPATNMVHCSKIYLITW